MGRKPFWRARSPASLVPPLVLSGARIDDSATQLQRCGARLRKKAEGLRGESLARCGGAAVVPPTGFEPVSLP